MSNTEADQDEAIAFLKAELGGSVEAVRTHISVVMLGADRVFKLKRAVALPYVDFTDVKARLTDSEREIVRNQRTAKTLYRRVRRVTRAHNGLEFDGPGELVEAVVEMGRFSRDDLFARMADSGQLSAVVATDLATVIADFHASLSPLPEEHSSVRMTRVFDGVEVCLLAGAETFGRERVASYCSRCRKALAAYAPRLDARGRAGAVALAHGDLHLGNICFWQGAPTLFDCLEFDDELATVDRAYDFAFLLMDLWRRDHRSTANIIFNRYLDRIDDETDLILTPLMMSIRAAIRAHVSAAQLKLDDARAFFDLASRLLTPASPLLLAVGGFSGSGKSTVAAALAAYVGSPPGARVLGSDRIRKALFGVPEHQRLPASAYDSATTAATYDRLATRAEKILGSGWSIVAEATFASERERVRIESASASAGVPFLGIWLETDSDTLRRRVDGRRGDVSDADVGVLQKQLREGEGSMCWIRVNASASVNAIVSRILALPAACSADALA